MGREGEAISHFRNLAAGEMVHISKSHKAGTSRPCGECLSCRGGGPMFSHRRDVITSCVVSCGQPSSCRLSSSWRVSF
jgi:hypothetical protein